MKIRSIKISDDLYHAITEYSESKEWSIHKSMLKGLESFFLKPSKTSKPKSKAVTVSKDEPLIVEAWEYWKEIHNAHDEKLSDPRKKLIKKAIADHDIEKVKNAILGITRDNWYMNKGLNSINQILKNEENIFKFSNNVGANADARFENLNKQGQHKLSKFEESKQRLKQQYEELESQESNDQVLGLDDGGLF